MSNSVNDIRLAQLQASEVELQIQKINEEIKKERILFEGRISPLLSELDELNRVLDIHYSCNLKHVSVVEWKNQKSGSVYLKGMFYCYKPGAAKISTASVHIGKLDDFPLGKNDPRAYELGILKAQKYINERNYTIKRVD